MQLPSSKLKRFMGVLYTLLEHQYGYMLGPSMITVFGVPYLYTFSNTFLTNLVALNLKYGMANKYGGS